MWFLLEWTQVAFMLCLNLRRHSSSFWWFQDTTVTIKWWNASEMRICVQTVSQNLAKLTVKCLLWNVPILLKLSMVWCVIFFRKLNQRLIFLKFQSWAMEMPWNFMVATNQIFVLICVLWKWMNSFKERTSMFSIRLNWLWGLMLKGVPIILESNWTNSPIL